MAAGKSIMTRQSSTWCAHCAHSSRTISFELYGEKVDPNLSQSHGKEKEKEKEKEEDHYMCLNNNGNSIRPCNDRRALSFELFSEKIDPNLNQSNHEKEKEYDHNYRFLIGNIDNSLYRSNSMDTLDACNNEPDFMDNGYRSDGLPNGSSHYIHDKKKGLPWTRDEHKSFLIGLEKLGKGDWRGISKKYVQSRTPTQVASHAQKYFIRLKAREKGKGRSSLFDMPKESMRYGNAHKSSTPECSKMVHCGPNMNIGGFYPFNNSSTQRTSQVLFMSQPLTKTDGSTSKSKEDVLQTK